MADSPNHETRAQNVGGQATNDLQTVDKNLETRLTRLWGIDKPIVGAPMAGRADGHLAAAVSRAGGLGMFGAGAGSSAEWIKENAEIAREGGAFGIGLMLWALKDNPEQFEAVLEAKPTAVSLGFGDPSPYVERAHDAGISVVAPVNDIAQLKAALAAEVDVICVQGTDAGGHTGHIGTMPLMQLVLNYIEIHAPGIPVCVAGGIGSGRGVAAALAAGADAAWVGTALLGSPESVGSEELRALAVKSGSSQTVLTDIYDRAEQQKWDTEKWPTRTVRNAFVDAYAPLSEQGEVTDRELVEARAEGGDYAGELKLHAGQGIGLLRAQVPAGEVVQKLNDEAWDCLNRW
ncbi:putative oxidoreductase [Corynebacterium resistens DSM 45100]|uniref:Oxidoreductase n=1 Tax=Corynebacterium resistens (strain DSM 45100 / JCM 12819 / GTC 2026 / SICGH 158) TaxID=662755 RepID=F8DYE9_CORRG|nr:nitronate monooxygenase [Corynebacterium resistens]AEI08842.1 putative oxidoreductase [Corynebacterium resistens DSM 45100]